MYSKIWLKRTLYESETWINGKQIAVPTDFPCKFDCVKQKAAKTENKFGNDHVPF